MLADTRVARTTALLLLGAALAGCAADGPVKGVAEAAGLATSVQQPKPFVQESRQAQAEYIPVGRPFGELPLCRTEASPPPGPTSVRGATGSFILAPVDVSGPCKPRTEFKTIEAELEAKRVSNVAAGSQAETLGKALPPPAPAKPIPTN